MGDLSQTSSVMVATFGIVLLVHDVRTTPFILGLGLTAWILAVAQLDNPFRSRWLLDLLALDGLIIPPEHRSAHLAGLAHWRSGGEGPILGRTIEKVESEAGNRSLFRAQIGLVVGDLPPRPARLAFGEAGRPALDERENQALLERLREARVGIIEIEPRPVTGARSLRGLPLLGLALTRRAVLAVLDRGLSGNPETERARLRRVS